MYAICGEMISMTRYQCKICVYGNLVRRSFRCDTNIYGKDSDIYQSIWKDQDCPTYIKAKYITIIRRKKT